MRGRERFLPADCVTATERSSLHRRGESRGDYALACFIFEF
jgi:hypothetical protein